MAWCSDGEGKALTHELIERGWGTVAHDIEKQIKAHKSTLPAQWSDPELIARFEEYLTCPDGPKKPNEFRWHGLPYFLLPKSFDVISAIWPDRIAFSGGCCFRDLACVGIETFAIRGMPSYTRIADHEVAQKYRR